MALVAAAVLGSFRPDIADSALRQVGFHQPWDVYAPEPLRRAEILEAIITYADGGRTTWRIPRAGALFPYPTHRWERWQDEITDDFSNTWEQAARWVVRHHARPNRVARHVVLRRRWAVIPPPNSRSSELVWNDHDFFTLALP